VFSLVLVLVLVVVLVLVLESDRAERGFP